MTPSSSSPSTRRSTSGWGCCLSKPFRTHGYKWSSSVINPKGSARQGEFSRCDEYIFFVQIGNAGPLPQDTDMLHDRRTSEAMKSSGVA